MRNRSISASLLIETCIDDNSRSRLTDHPTAISKLTFDADPTPQQRCAAAVRILATIEYADDAGASRDNVADNATVTPCPRARIRIF